MFSHAVRSWSRLGSWKTTPRRRRTSSRCAVGSSPSNSIWPLVGRRSVVSILIVVVLPAPFGPRKAKTSPRRTSNDTSSTAVSSPKRFTRFWTLIIREEITSLKRSTQHDASLKIPEGDEENSRGQASPCELQRAKDDAPPPVSDEKQFRP